MATSSRGPIYKIYIKKPNDHRTYVWDTHDLMEAVTFCKKYLKKMSGLKCKCVLDYRPDGVGFIHRFVAGEWSGEVRMVKRLLD